VITLYRIVKQKYATHAFDGKGARLYGGRWNSIGRSCVYVAGSESLAILEILVHLNRSMILDHYVLFTLELEENDTMILNHADLPANWREEPAPQDTADLGDQWLASLSSVALSVPSSIVPRERNYILNVAHPRFDELIASAKQYDMSLDRRLL
jgi:RES domain-containing protein